jgi:signal transduction histidine kinase/CheY-like chemotaxis protein/HPt (histidine-containing phosphotransfer) domain-containing protein
VKRFRDLSVRTKLLVLVCASSGLVLGLCCLGFVTNDVRTIRAAKVEEFTALAKMLAFNSSAVVTFHDAAAGRGLLSSLESQPAVDYACLMDAAGRPLASYVRAGAQAPPSVAPAEEGCRFTASGHLELSSPILEDGNFVGSLFLRSDMKDLRRQLWHYAAIALGVMAGATGIAAIFAMRVQRIVSRPVVQLAEAAKRISLEGDCSLRVSWDSGDELGALYRDFNHMLERLQAAEAALRQANDELEERVQLRTAQLRAEIAEREQAQAAVEHARDAAEAASRAKSEFLANMSHEIRTPLNAVLGFAELLLRGGDQGDPAAREEYLATIHASSTHLLSLINDVLDLSKIEAGKLEIERVPCSPDQLLAEVISVLRVRAHEKGLSLDYEWTTPVPETIRSDPARLRQLLVNLIGNAIKFTAQGGVRVIGRVTGPADRPQLEFSILDTGIGVPRDKWESIFDPFVQADNSVTRQFGGTGLGLAISRRIAEALGGRITVQSEPGRGSTFTVSVETGLLDGVPVLEPSRADVRPAAVPRGPVGPPAAMPRGRVLVVEDGDANRKLIGLVLRQAGLEVTTAENGQLGVEAAVRQPFDLILMDMQMPIMDGYTATTVLRQRGVTIPIFALTAHAMKGDEEKCRAAGCSGYVTKPIEIDLLLSTVAEALLGRKTKAEGHPEGTRRKAEDGAGHPPSGVADNGPGTADNGQPTRPPSPPLVCKLPLDDPEFREIVEEFVARLHVQLAAMRQALEGEHFEELGRLAHWLKGSGGTAGFPALTTAARSLEALLPGRSRAAVGRALDELDELAERIVLPAADVQS